MGECLVLGEALLTDGIAPHRAGARRLVVGRQIGDRNKEGALGAEQQRLGIGARLADMVEVDLPDASAGMDIFRPREDQDLVGIVPVDGEAGDVEIALKGGGDLRKMGKRSHPIHITTYP
jgi:hypothetical protein